MADVDWDFAADVTAAEKAMARLEQKVERLENKLRNVHRTSDRGTSKFVRDMQAWATGLVSVGAAYSVVSRSIGAVIEQNRQLADEVSQLIKRLSEEELKLQIQAGFTPAALEQQLPIIGQQLLQTPAVDLPQALSLSTQLVSSGFKQADVASGEALQTMLQLQAATNQFGRALENPKETTKALSQLLKGLGLENTAANMRAIGGDFAELFAGFDIQAKDLTDLAGVAATMTAAKQTPQVQLAAFTGLTEILGGAQAATTLKQLTSMSIAAANNPQAVRALESMGMTPADIDLAGESIIDVFDRFRQAGEQMDPTEFQRAILGIYGQRAGANILSGAAVSPRVREALGTVEGEGFEQAVGIFQMSRWAGNMRTLIETQLLERQLGAEATWDEISDELKKLNAASAASDVGVLGRFQDIDALTDARAAAAVGRMLGLTPGELPGLDRLLDEIRSQTHILRELRDLQPNARQRTTRTINREGQTEGASGESPFTSTRN